MSRKRLYAIALSVTVLGVLIFFAARQCFPLFSNGRMGSRSPRLVILYATCTVNRNYLSPYNPAIDFTPHLDSFAKQSMVFTNHYTEAGQSGTAYASIFSGTQAHTHQVYRHPAELSEDLYLIGEAYADAGYETYFWSAHGMASPGLKYGQGVPGKRTFGNRVFTGNDPDFLRILARLRSDESYKAFVQVNFHVTHGPYKTVNFQSFINRYRSHAKGLPREEVKKCKDFSRGPDCNRLFVEHSNELQFDYAKAVRWLSAPVVSELFKLEELIYKSNVNRLDDIFGSMIGQIGLSDLLSESLIAFTVDHGEVLGREGAIFKWNHGAGMDPEVLRVPLIIYGKGVGIEPGVYEGVTRSIDVYPTMLGLSGLPAVTERGVEGLNVSEAMLGRVAVPQQLAFSHSTIVRGFKPDARRFDGTLLGELHPTDDAESIWVAVATEDFTYKWRSLGDGEWGFEIFDKATDPFETRNIYDERNRQHREMARRLVVYKKLLVDSFSSDGDEALREEEKFRLLRSLGYIG